MVKIKSDKKRHQIIIIPGLSDKTEKLKWVTRWWRKENLYPYLYPFGWQDNSTNFETKFNKLVQLIDKLSKQGDVSILGISAGGSAAFNALLKRSKIIKRAVNVCGRLRAGKHKWRSLDKMASKSRSFKESVLYFQKQETKTPPLLKSRLMTVTPMFGDELVPADTSSLPGAYNIKMPTGEHLLSITMALTLFIKPIIKFIKEL